MNQSQPDFSAIRAVVFDLDDTLCGYWEAAKTGIRRCFELCRPEGVSVETMLANWVAAFQEFCPTLSKSDWYPAYLESGEPTRTEQMRRALSRLGIVDEELADRMSLTYMEQRDSALALYDDALLALQTLKASYRLGMITNGPADIQRQEIGTLGIGGFFDSILIEGEVGFGKPRVEVFRLAESQLGVQPHEALFVGNSFSHDIRPAIAAGWRTVWLRRPTDVPFGKSSPEPIPADGPFPDLILSDLSSLVSTLELS